MCVYVCVCARARARARKIFESTYLRFKETDKHPLNTTHMVIGNLRAATSFSFLIKPSSGSQELITEM